MVVGVSVAAAAAVVVRVETGVRIGMFLPNGITCGAMGCWHALLPIITHARGPLLVRAGLPAGIARPLPDIVFFVVWVA